MSRRPGGIRRGRRFLFMTFTRCELTMTLRSLLFSLSLGATLLCAACGSSSSAPSTDGDGPDTPQEQESEAQWGDCKTLCLAYCDMARSCRVAGASDFECHSGCQTLQTQADFLARYACGIYESCDRYVSCRQDPAALSGHCTGLPPAPDGDPETERDAEDETETENETEAADPDDPRLCTGDSQCGYSEHCDAVSGACAPACDPTLIFCAIGKTCRALPSPEAQPRGACVNEWQGAAKGATCNAATLCAPGLFCGAAGRCETICNRQGTTDCGTGLSCKAQAGYAIETCRYCQGDAACGVHRLCKEGLCVSDGYCLSRYDCPQGEVCIAGACGPGCVNEADCQPGLGLCDAGLCYVNQCTEDCAAKGLCCARHQCGPCCTPSCGGNQLCSYGADCVGLACCLDQVDCRARPLGYCGEKVCDTLTGTCCEASASCLAIDGDADAAPYACPSCAGGAGTYQADTTNCAAPFATLTLTSDEAGCRVQIFKGEDATGEKLAALAQCDRALLYDSGTSTATRCVLLLDDGLWWKCETKGVLCRAKFSKRAAGR